MSLGSRKQLILQAIIEDYINTAEPVGSRTVSKKYLKDISPATIRNEMADLEEMGYIEQPHTSAGRVPSDKGYRLYVDRLMEQKTIDWHDYEFIRKEFMDTVGEIDRLIKHASKLLSAMTKYASIAMAPQFKRTCLKHLQLIKVDSHNILAVIVTDAGIIKNSVIRTDSDIEVDALEKISNMLNQKLIGLSIEELVNMDITKINSGINNNEDYKQVLTKVLPELLQALRYSERAEIYSDGAANLLDLPEYSDVQKAKDFFSILDKNDILYEILKDVSEKTTVTIGKENKIHQLKDCSIITATYSYNGKVIGSIGVLGPTRMNYSKVISIVDCLTQNLNDILTKIIKT
ncbi:heat-inducible transcriptional repressor HrcA [Lutispora thermophila]|uniref:Heat-inducible transcription repressor HrcA n=1 Tax=Lutispora thermophila DSM 19022 TaxID=1122184 RepID=A0A1M6DCE6_9FIRM|nr:heat-inducible transcriptional repressor HrcA [Lutispora thermophila]SHI70820.1 heat-inducible transcription repressor HrcA [Lutispora thermophila DSM 19022]